MRTLILDIDGCITTYSEYFIYWLNKKYNKNFLNSAEVEEYYGKYYYKILWTLYNINGGYEEGVHIKEGAPETIFLLNWMFDRIIIVTRRPIVCKKKTINWLNREMVMYNQIFFTDIEGKKRIINELKHDDLIVVDDEERFKLDGVKTFIFGKDIFTWKDLLRKIYKLHNKKKMIWTEVEKKYGKETADKMKSSHHLKGIRIGLTINGEIYIRESDVRNAFRETLGLMPLSNIWD